MKNHANNFGDKETTKKSEFGLDPSGESGNAKSGTKSSEMAYKENLTSLQLLWSFSPGKPNFRGFVYADKDEAVDLTSSGSLKLKEYIEKAENETTTSLCENINYDSLYQEKLFHDVTFKVKPKMYPQDYVNESPKHLKEPTYLHFYRIVLGANSNYFRSKENCSTEIDLSKENIHADKLKIILDSLLTGTITFTPENIYEIVGFSQTYQFNEILKKAIDYLFTITSIHNCFRNFQIFKDCNCYFESEYTFRFIKSKFKFIALQEHKINNLDFELLHRIFIAADLNISGEDQLIKILMSWIDDNVRERTKYLQVLASAIRFPVTSLCCIQEFTSWMDKLIEIIQGDKLITDKELKKMYSSMVENTELFIAHCRSKYFDMELMKSVSEPRHGEPEAPFLLLCLSGGKNGQGMSIDMSYDVGSCWFNISDSIPVRHNFSAVNNQEWIYVTGGNDEKQNPLRSCVAYNSFNNTWIKITDLPNPLIHHSSILFENKLFVIGGIRYFDQEEGSEKVFYYSENKKQWINNVVHMEVGRFGHFSCVVDKTIFSIGGAGLNSGEKLSIGEEKWTSIAPMKHKRCFSSGVLCNRSEILIAGGENEDYYVKEMELYDCDTDQWTSIAHRLIYGRVQFGFARYEERYFFVGGRSEDESHDDMMEMYTVEPDRWIHSHRYFKNKNKSFLFLLPP